MYRLILLFMFFFSASSTKRSSSSQLFYRNPRRLIGPPRFTPDSTAGIPGAPARLNCASAARGAINKAAKPHNIAKVFNWISINISIF